MTAVERLLYIIDDTSKRGQPPLQTRVPDPAFHPRMSGEACSGNSVEVRSWRGSPCSSHRTLLHTTPCLLTHPWHPYHRGFSLLVKNMHDTEHLMSSMWNKLIHITTSQHRQWINLLHRAAHGGGSWKTRASPGARGWVPHCRHQGQAQLLDVLHPAAAGTTRNLRPPNSAPASSFDPAWGAPGAGPAAPRAAL